MNEFVKFLEDSMERLQQKETELAASNRKDEANLMKIRINIYGICKTILEVEARGKSDEKLRKAYMEKLEQLPTNWKIAYEKAKQYNDVEKVVIETIKLEALEEVKERLQKTWREELC